MMKRRSIPTFEEVLDATGNEWEEVPHGSRLLVSQDPILASRNRIEIRLPRGAAATFRARPREKYVARLSRGKLIVERPPVASKKRAHHG
jgi:hypothetical protein